MLGISTSSPCACTSVLKHRCSRTIDHDCWKVSSRKQHCADYKGCNRFLGCNVGEEAQRDIVMCITWARFPTDPQLCCIVLTIYCIRCQMRRICCKIQDVYQTSLLYLCMIQGRPWSTVKYCENRNCRLFGSFNYSHS